MIDGIIASYDEYLVDLPDAERIGAAQMLKRVLTKNKETMTLQLQREFDDFPISTPLERKRRRDKRQNPINKHRVFEIDNHLDEMGNWRIVGKTTVGDGVVVRLANEQPGAKFDGLQIELLFQRSSGGPLRWVELHNPWEFMQAFVRREYQYRFQQNEPDRERIGNAIQLTRIERNVVSNASFVERWIQVVLYLTNNSARVITGWDGTLEIKSPTGKRLRLFHVDARETNQQSGNTLAYTYQFKVNPRDRDDVYLCRSQAEDLKAVLWVNGVDFSTFESVKVRYPEVLGDRVSLWDLMESFTAN